MSEATQSKGSSSGTVTIEGDRIHWTHEGKLLGTIDLSQTVVVGEYTTSDGPWLDDWFVVFVLADGTFLCVPMYVDGREDLILAIQTYFKTAQTVGALAGSTNWASLVDHPIELIGQPLFRLQLTKDYLPPKTWLAKLFYGLGLGKFNTDQEILLSEPVESFLKSREVKPE
jgi:hypothetical protein